MVVMVMVHEHLFRGFRAFAVGHGDRGRVQKIVARGSHSRCDRKIILYGVAIVIVAETKSHVPRSRTETTISRLMLLKKTKNDINHIHEIVLKTI